MCKNVATGPLALLLSIIATVSHQWPHDDPGHKALFATSADSKHRTIAWAKAALDVIDYSARVASRSIEHVQALLHICYVLFHLDGFSTQLGSVFGTTVTYARSLGLHIIDLPRSMDGTSNPHPGGLAAEMGRRVWWSVVTLDWLLAQRCYPLGGFDLMNPTLTAVNLPRDCNDDEIEGNVPSIQGPSSMTFHILKIKLVEVCRDFSAGGSSSPAVPSETIYSGVMRSDAKLNTFIRELPPAFQLNHDASITESQRTRSSRPPRVLTAQCYMLNLSIQAQLCKLHLPYLFRAAVDPAVTYSRQACLRAAQQVIRIECVLENKTEPPFLHGLFHHRGVLYILSLACIVLLLDSCLVSAAGSNTAPSRETSEAYRLLEDASKYSPTSETLFNALVQLLMRHRVSLPVHMTIVGTETRACEADVVDTVSGMDTMKDGDVCTALAGFQGGLWDELWPSEANGVGVGGLDWKDTLLAEIDLSFM
ncbi:hypothetical protein BJY04DRAFT_219139 [Aspergillus karnatakaensis]|uniref:fungal specific transcription factor domain-containing protein n=1 Tax=Aspergillus karnatakaensis TaxID=1810916 RepID=UPI003CCCCB0B